MDELGDICPHCKIWYHSYDTEEPNCTKCGHPSRCECVLIDTSPRDPYEPLWEQGWRVFFVGPFNSDQEVGNYLDTKLLPKFVDVRFLHLVSVVKAIEKYQRLWFSSISSDMHESSDMCRRLLYTCFRYEYFGKTKYWQNSTTDEDAYYLTKDFDDSLKALLGTTDRLFGYVNLATSVIYQLVGEDYITLKINPYILQTLSSPTTLYVEFLMNKGTRFEEWSEKKVDL